MNTNDIGRLERTAEFASIQEIRQTKREIENAMPTLEGDDKAFAQGLLLKLDHLIGLQLAPSVPNNVMAFPGRMPEGVEECPAESEPVAA